MKIDLLRGEIEWIMTAHAGNVIRPHFRRAEKWWMTIQRIQVKYFLQLYFRPFAIFSFGSLSPVDCEFPGQVIQLVCCFLATLLKSGEVNPRSRRRIACCSFRFLTVVLGSGCCCITGGCTDVPPRTFSRRNLTRSAYFVSHVVAKEYCFVLVNFVVSKTDVTRVLMTSWFE